MNIADDSRADALSAWAEARLGQPLRWTVVSADASRRRYFRARPIDAETPTWIAVDAPPAHENMPAFVAAAELLAAAGLNVPHIHARDETAGFLLLSDFGDRRYIDVLDTHNADALFGAAIGALLDWQAASRPGLLPDYDRATFQREMALFHEWFLPSVLGITPDAEAQAALQGAYDFILERVLAQSPVFVHRDFMPRNLMIADPLPGVLDFQDARYGPATYDVASLFRDAFISWPADRVQEWIRHYWDGAIGRGLPVASDWTHFLTDLALTGAQRHLKVLGLFVRIAERDGKPDYARDLPRFVDYLMPVTAAHDQLAPVHRYLVAARPALGMAP
ncbi:aminoglycoside phosphotransferase family protein [Salinisphaera sp. Q1T1-3]|uniref:aminoglycoside phosphotransferase family protein n=1 Tax=Salinisphaera sp. Q1T1-3 TaxID=2321229 RepID=UPI000E721D09|nr:phosphotransferase [Salinisphaera sp. Q1T1-3]RJS93998.1 aminoglycoside phosphotransferase [Salinisphaera sp. Q1T1-3]